MADISKDELRKEITAILKDADLTAMSAKKVRQQLEEKLDCDLGSRKKEIDDLVMDYVNPKDKKKKKPAPQDESEEEEEEEDVEEEEEEESEEEKKPAKRASTGKKPAAKKSKKPTSDESDASEVSDAESEEEYSPKKSKPPKARKLPPKKKKGSDSDSDEDWGKSAKKAGGGSATKKGGGAKRGGGGYTKVLNLSPELASLMGQEMMARHEVVKRIWEIIKDRHLYDPKNKQFAICDDELFKVIGVKRFRTFGMMKYLKTHFID